MTPSPRHVEMGGKIITQKHRDVDSNVDKCLVNNNYINGDKNSECVSEDVSDFDLAKYEDSEFRSRIKWPDLIVQVLLHTVSIYGVFLIVTREAKLYTALFGKFIIFLYFKIYCHVSRLASNPYYDTKRARLRFIAGTSVEHRCFYF